MKSLIEGQRSLAFWVSQQIDVSLNHSDSTIKKNANDMVSMMTPLIKSFFTDIGVEITNDAIQVFGGYGYIKDFPVEKFYRDSKLCTIGEGTSEIQKLVISRKILSK